MGNAHRTRSGQNYRRVKMRVYISGKITGDKHHKRKFAKVERKLKRAGHTVLNPARINANMPKDTSWMQYMVVSLAELLTADAIYMLHDWKASKGARLEHKYAREHNKTIVYEEE